MISDEAKKLRNEYMRKYRKNHPEKVKKQNQLYWERKAEKENNKKENNN